MTTPIKCDDFSRWMADYWEQGLDEAQEAEFERHRQSCTACHAQFERLDGLWKRLPELPADEPGRQQPDRFYAMLTAYEQGMDSMKQAAGNEGGWTAWMLRWWPAQPLQQWAVACGLLLIGLVTGYAGSHVMQRGSSSEMADLREEVRGMHQMVALSLMQQSSASERLRGVSWAFRAEPSNIEILSALLSAVNDDPNVNVRLAAVDALHAFAAIPRTRQAARESLKRQDAPLVQVALIDLLVDLKEQQASPELRRLASDGSVNDGVKQRALWALDRLQESGTVVRQ
ncbi:MAG: HEAT repeat domain-containing protein [Acidobacteriota bacterium]